MKDDKLYLNQIRDSVSKVEEFTAGMSRADFENNQETQSATILQLILVGEIAKKLSEETKNRVDVPWKEIIGFRDTAIHHYFSVSLDIVWETVQSDIPILKEKLSAEK